MENIKSEVLGILEKLKKSKARVAGYGAPAKGNTLLNYLGLTAKDLECVAGTNALKQGCLTPGLAYTHRQ